MAYRGMDKAALDAAYNNGAAVGLVPEVAQGDGERLGVGRRHEHSVDAVAYDVAVAGDV